MRGTLRAAGHPRPPRPTFHPLRPPTEWGATPFRHSPRLGRAGGSLTLPGAPAGFRDAVPSFLGGDGQQRLSGGTAPSSRYQDGDRSWWDSESREPLPLPNAPCAGDDGTREGGGAAHGEGRSRALRLRSPPGAVARPVARAACRDTRPAPPILPAFAAVARSAFSPRWWPWARGDCRRRQNLNPPWPEARHTALLSLAHTPPPPLVRHLCRPGAHGRGRRRLPRLLLGAALGAARSPAAARRAPQPPGWAGSVGAAAGDQLGVFCGAGAPSPGLGLRRKKRGSRMSAGGGGSERERGGGGRRRRARATTTSEAAAAARAAAQARGRRQVGAAEAGPWAGDAGRQLLGAPLSPKRPAGRAPASAGAPPAPGRVLGGAWGGGAGASGRPWRPRLPPP